MFMQSTLKTVQIRETESIAAIPSEFMAMIASKKRGTIGDESKETIEEKAWGYLLGLDGSKAGKTGLRAIASAAKFKKGSGALTYANLFSFSAPRVAGIIQDAKAKSITKAKDDKNLDANQIAAKIAKLEENAQAAIAWVNAFVPNTADVLAIIGYIREFNNIRSFHVGKGKNRTKAGLKAIRTCDESVSTMMGVSINNADCFDSLIAGDSLSL